MLVRLAQVFQAVRREVDDHQPPARREQAPRLRHRAAWIGQVVQHPGAPRPALQSRSAGPWRRCPRGGVRRAPGRSGRPRRGRCSAFAGRGPGRWRGGRAGRAGSACGPRPVPRSISPTVGRRRRRLDDRRLHRRFRDVERADLVPVGGVAGEIGAGVVHAVPAQPSPGRSSSSFRSPPSSGRRSRTACTRLRWGSAPQSR